VREIAYTAFGRNALSTGLVSHIAALLAGMMPVSGSQAFFGAAYTFACLAFAIGAYVELKGRGYAPLRSLSFYGAAAAAVLPVIGPVIALLMLYSAQGERKEGRFTLWGMLASIPRLKVNPLVLFFFLAILFIFFALTVRQHDPYFKRANAGRVSLSEQKGTAGAVPL
jgi:hypothetical protein